MRTTSGVCVPGAAWLVFVPFAWASALENAPILSNATAMPMKQKRAAITVRRLKKADFEVDFFFIDEVKCSFPAAVNPKTAGEMLGEMMEVCQQLFLIFSWIFSVEAAVQAA